MNKESKLGMGLGALLSTPSIKDNKGLQKINISQIKPNPSQPRKNFKEDDQTDSIDESTEVGLTD